MINLKRISTSCGIAIAMVAIAPVAWSQTTLLSDSFDRTVGTPTENGMIDDGMGGMMPNPLAETSWGDNDNANGGDIVQTYEIGPEIRGGNRHQYVDGDLARFRAGWAEIQHDFAADPRVSAGGGLKIEFDARISDATVGWLALSIGQSEAETTDGGDNNSIFLMVEDTVDFGVLFGGINGSGTATPMQIFEGDDFPDAPFTSAFDGDWGFGSSPNDEQRFRIEIASDDFAVDGTNATANIFVTHPTFGERQVLTNYAFDWDADGEAYVAFSSNKDQGCNPAGCEDPNQEVQIDNLVISTLTTVELGNGDYNGDGLVDAADYTVWRDTFGQTVTALSGADGDGDGEIGQGDYDLWASRFGDAPGVATAVPEPSAWLIVCLGGMAAASRRRV